MSSEAILTLHSEQVTFFAELPINRGSFSNDINDYEPEKHHWLFRVEVDVFLQHKHSMKLEALWELRTPWSLSLTF